MGLLGPLTSLHETSTPNHFSTQTPKEYFFYLKRVLGAIRKEDQFLGLFFFKFLRTSVKYVFPVCFLSINSSIIFFKENVCIFFIH